MDFRRRAVFSSPRSQFFRCSHTVKAYQSAFSRLYSKAFLMPFAFPLDSSSSFSFSSHRLYTRMRTASIFLFEPARLRYNPIVSLDVFERKEGSVFSRMTSSSSGMFVCETGFAMLKPFSLQLAHTAEHNDMV